MLPRAILASIFLFSHIFLLFNKLQKMGKSENISHIHSAPCDNKPILWSMYETDSLPL